MSELIDKSMIDQMAEDLGPDMFADILQVFEEQLREHEAFFAGCRMPDQAAEIQDISHQLKSSAGSCGAVVLQAHATALNDASRAASPDPGRIEAELRKVRELLPGTRAALEQVRLGLQA
jgi:HPt (histidine-containing phosphotransfer) domain-containing protein